MIREKIYIVDWYVKNFILLENVFQGDHSIDYDDGAYSWFLIRDMEMPSNFEQRVSDLLLTFRGISEFTNQDYFYSDDSWDSDSAFIPDSFYLDKGLKNKYGRTPSRLGHFTQKKIKKKGYERYCLSMKFWVPSSDIVSGDNFLVYIELIMEKLKLSGGNDT